MVELQKSAEELIKIHGISKGSPPRNAELWEQFRDCSQTEKISLQIENRFYTGYNHSNIDWTRPVHAVVADFKGDGMQMGMLIEQLENAGCQYTFIGNPPPFNHGWHFTAVNDFEHKEEQERLDPKWQNIRIWHQIGYVPTTTESGAPALTPRDIYKPENKYEGALPITKDFKFAFIHLIGGLMPHALNATVFGDKSPASLVFEEHFKLGATFAAIGHGLDILIALGTEKESRIKGFEAAVFPKQEHLLEIHSIRKSPECVCSYKHDSGMRLVSASFWGNATANKWFQAVGLGEMAASHRGEPSPSNRIYVTKLAEPIMSLDVSKLQGMTGATYSPKSGPPRVAVFVDQVTDPIEIYVTLMHLIKENLNFQLVSHSNGEGTTNPVKIASETVFGNANYGLCDCRVEAMTTPANFVSASSKFDAFIVVGGQCPYYLMQDSAIIAFMNNATIAAAVCHGPEALIGSKWLHPSDGKPVPQFTSYYGCWMSFRDVFASYVKKKPGEVCQGADGYLITGNAPNSTKELVALACIAIKEKISAI